MRALVPDYEIARCADLPSTLTLLNETTIGARPIAGGTDLMVLFEAGKLKHKTFVDISHLTELNGIRLSAARVEIGALTTYTDVREHSVLAQEFPLLAQSAAWTGAVAIQNRGTLGGNIANASPAADTAPVLLCYDADVTLISIRGERQVPLKDFFVGYKQTALQPGEIIKAISFARTFKTWRQNSRKVGTRKAQAISKLFMAFAADFADDFTRDLNSAGSAGKINDVRIGLGSLGPHPLRAVQTEAFLRGKSLDAQLIAGARNALANELKPIDDIRSNATYRRLVATNLLEDFLLGLRAP